MKARIGHKTDFSVSSFAVDVLNKLLINLRDEVFYIAITKLV